MLKSHKRYKKFVSRNLILIPTLALDGSGLALKKLSGAGEYRLIRERWPTPRPRQSEWRSGWRPDQFGSRPTVSHDHRSRRRPAVRARPDISTIGECCRVGDWACCRWTTVTRGGAECGIGRGDVPPHRIGSRHNRLRSYGHRQGDQAWLACLVAEIPIFSKFTFSLNSYFL